MFNHAELCFAETFRISNHVRLWNSLRLPKIFIVFWIIHRSIFDHVAWLLSLPTLPAIADSRDLDASTHNTSIFFESNIPNGILLLYAAQHSRTHNHEHYVDNPARRGSATATPRRTKPKGAAQLTTVCFNFRHTERSPTADTMCNGNSFLHRVL